MINDANDDFDYNDVDDVDNNNEADTTNIFFLYFNYPYAGIFGVSSFVLHTEVQVWNIHPMTSELLTWQSRIEELIAKKSSVIIVVSLFSNGEED